MADTPLRWPYFPWVPRDGAKGKTLPHPVAIIGGGVGGLSLAISLQRAGLPFVVFERDPCSGARSSGYGMTMQACSALRDLGILDRVREQDTQSTEHWTFSPHGHILGYFGNGLSGGDTGVYERELGERGNLRIPREALLKTMREQLLHPEEAIRWGHKVASFEEVLKEGEEEGVWVRFEGEGPESPPPPPFFCSVLVGADGLRSRVRSLCLSRGLSSAAPPPPLTYMGVVLILGISTFEHPLVSARGFYTLDGNARLFTMPYSTHPHLHMWQLSFSSPGYAGGGVGGEGGEGGSAAHTAATHLRTLSSQALLELALGITAGWHTPVEQLLKGSVPGSVWATSLADLGGSVTCVGELPSLSGGGGGGDRKPLQRVVLIGDAAHPMSPFKGQGANQSLMDGPLLASWLCKASPTCAIRAFEREMSKRAGAKVAASRAAARHLHSPAVLLEVGEVKGLPSHIPSKTVLQWAREKGVGAHLGEGLLKAFRECIKECGEEMKNKGALQPPPPSPPLSSSTHKGVVDTVIPSLSPPPPVPTSPPTWTLLYYCYAPLGVDGREAMLQWLRGPLGPVAGGCVGRIRVGLDGVNASIGASSREVLEAHAASLNTHPNPLSPTLPARPIDFKYAPTSGPRSAEAVRGCCFDGPVRLVSCAEIVTLGLSGGVGGEEEASVDKGGVHLSPIDFHSRLLASKGPSTAVIDVRNLYEHNVGRFLPPDPTTPLLLPPVRTFAEMPSWLDSSKEVLNQCEEVLMYCTGGVRCERFSALVKSRFPGKRVFQLEGGIQRYMEAGERGELVGGGGGSGCGAWAGKLFVFDERPPVKAEGKGEGEGEGGGGGAGKGGGILGTCCLCSKPWDTYLGWVRCGKCGMLVLVCDVCQEARGRGEGEGSGDDTKDHLPPLHCERCIKGGGGSGGGTFTHTLSPASSARQQQQQQQPKRMREGRKKERERELAAAAVGGRE